MFGELFEETEAVAIAVGAQAEEEAFAGFVFGGNGFGVDANDFADFAPEGVGLAFEGVTKIGDNFALEDFGGRNAEDIVFLADADAGFVAEFALDEGLGADKIGKRIRETLRAAGHDGQIETRLGAQGKRAAQEQQWTHCYYDLPYAAVLVDFGAGGRGVRAGHRVCQGELHKV